MSQESSHIGIKEHMLTVFNQRNTENSVHFESSMALLHELVLGSRELFQKYLEAIPEDILQQVWNQSKCSIFPDNMEQLSIDFSPAVLEPEPLVFQCSERPGEYQINQSVTLDELFVFVHHLLQQQFMRVDVVQKSEDMKRFLMVHLATRAHEVFACVFLDNQHRVIAFEELFRGTIASCTVYPREVLKQALEHNAAAVVFAHNHPSGLPSPSEGDKEITQKLKEVLALVDIRVLDHIVIGGSETTSFAEQGLL